MQDELIRSFDLSGRVAVVTGAASGIGRGTAQVLAEAGASIVLADIQEAGLAETASIVSSVGGQSISRKVDVTRQDDVDQLAVAAVQAMGKIDIWVNSAGTILSRMIMDATERDLETVIGVNLKGVYWGCAAAGRAMKDQGSGSIINLSSSGGETAIPELSIYSLTKAAVNALTRTAAKEFGPFGIRVNAVAPGWIDTPMGKRTFVGANGEIDPAVLEEGLRLRRQVSPLGITGTPRDMGLAILYLASDASRFMTGQIMRPNGGVSMP